VTQTGSLAELITVTAASYSGYTLCQSRNALAAECGRAKTKIDNVRIIPAPAAHFSDRVEGAARGATRVLTTVPSRAAMRSAAQVGLVG
jgi:hypothetical protein